MPGPPKRVPMVVIKLHECTVYVMDIKGLYYKVL